jgi:hypothetical protein
VLVSACAQPSRLAVAPLSHRHGCVSTIIERSSSASKPILDKIEKLNPDFYPMALDPPQEIAAGKRHFPRPTDGFLTKDDLVFLYCASSAVLHTPNPYTAKDPTIQI